MASSTPWGSADPVTQHPHHDQPQASADDQLRRLAAVETQYRQLLASMDESTFTPAQSLTFFKLADSTRRTAHVSMVRAAGAVRATEAHRLSQGSLEQVFAQDIAGIADGEALATNQLLPATAKAHYRSEVDVLAQLGDLKPHSVKALLMAHRQLVGSPQQPPQFATLGKRFADPSSNPEVISQAAAKIAGLQLRGKARKQAESRVVNSSAQGQCAVSAELKSLSDELSTPNLPEREAVHERCAGLRYRGLGPRGHIWELTCTTLDHEFISMLADRLVNPNLAVNRRGSAFRKDAEPTSPGLADDDYNDPASVKARKLLNTIIGVLRRQASPGGRTQRKAEGTNQAELAAPSSEEASESGLTEDTEFPLPPMLDLIVTIDYDALFAKTTAAGLTSHGQRISATQLRQTAAIAGIIPEVLGSDGEILDYGRRRRLFTAAQTRAVVGRDRGCINPGCRMPAHRCEVNHCQPWYRGGKTSVDNGCLLCKSCHMAFHAGHFKIKMINAVPYVQQSPERDPEQLWRRNWQWHPQATALAA